MHVCVHIQLFESSATQCLYPTPVFVNCAERCIIYICTCVYIYSYLSQALLRASAWRQRSWILRKGALYICTCVYIYSFSGQALLCSSAGLWCAQILRKGILCMYMYVCVYMYVYIYMHARVPYSSAELQFARILRIIILCIYIYVCTCICIHTCACACASTLFFCPTPGFMHFAKVRICSIHIYTCLYIYVYIYICVCVRAWVRVQILCKDVNIYYAVCMSHIWMNRVTHVNKSCHTYTWMSHVTHINEYCRTACKLCKRVNLMANSENQSRHTHDRVLSSFTCDILHIVVSSFIWANYTYKSRHTHDRVVSSFIRGISYIVVPSFVCGILYT